MKKMSSKNTNKEISNFDQRLISHNKRRNIFSEEKENENNKKNLKIENIDKKFFEIKIIRDNNFYSYVKKESIEKEDLFTYDFNSPCLSKKVRIFKEKKENDNLLIKKKILKKKNYENGNSGFKRVIDVRKRRFFEMKKEKNFFSAQIEKKKNLEKQKINQDINFFIDKNFISFKNIPEKIIKSEIQEKKKKFN